MSDEAWKPKGFGRMQPNSIEVTYNMSDSVEQKNYARDRAVEWAMQQKVLPAKARLVLVYMCCRSSAKATVALDIRKAAAQCAMSIFAFRQRLVLIEKAGLIHRLRYVMDVEAAQVTMARWLILCRDHSDQDGGAA